MLRNSALAALALLLIAGAAQAADDTHSVNSSADPGARIQVIETLPADTEPLQTERAVLFVHGATYPGLTFDLAVPGYNWMDYVAERGFAAYAVDIRGYGGSSRPRQMAGPAAKAKPVMRAPAAVRDILDAVDFIRRRTGVPRVNLVGWSWGTVTAGAFAAEYPTMVERLVLYAPVYSLYLPDRLKVFRLADPEDENRFNPAIGAYRTVDAAGIRSRWEAQIVPDDKDEWRDAAVADAWIAALLASDPKSATYEPPPRCGRPTACWSTSSRSSPAARSTTPGASRRRRSSSAAPTTRRPPKRTPSASMRPSAPATRTTPHSPAAATSSTSNARHRC